MEGLLDTIEARLRDLLVPVDVLLPWKEGGLSGEIRKVCIPACLAMDNRLDWPCLHLAPLD